MAAWCPAVQTNDLCTRGHLLRELTERARTGGLKLTGEGGLLGKLTKMVVEGALEGELDDHLGYGKPRALAPHPCGEASSSAVEVAWIARFAPPLQPSWFL